MFLRYIDEFGPTHLKVLELLASLQEFFREKRRRDHGISTYRRTDARLVRLAYPQSAY